MAQQLLSKVSIEETKPAKSNSKIRVHHYYKCPRCGYVTIIKDSFCPVCTKEGLKIKVK